MKNCTVEYNITKQKEMRNDEMKRDPIEQTPEFQEALKIIQPELDEFSKRLDEQGNIMGNCHRYWQKKKLLLKSIGIDWHSPAECNPNVLFD